MADWTEKAFWLGSKEDGVYFDAFKYRKGWKVKALIDSDTGFFTDDLPVPGLFKTRKDAIDKAICAALEWCMKNGVWVAAKDIEAVRKSV